MGYFSMKEVVDKLPWLVETLSKSLDECGYGKEYISLRGGTDGSALSQRGLPCPNITAGYEYGHGRYEFASIQAMAKSTAILVRVCENLGKL